MTAAERDWIERHIALWSARAVELRAMPGRAAANRALGVGSVVADLERRIAAAPAPVAADAAAIGALEARLAKIAPRIEAGVTINGGPIMAAVRQQLVDEMARAGCETLPPGPPAVLFVSPPCVPMAPPVPFTAGPQLGLFG